MMFRRSFFAHLIKTMESLTSIPMDRGVGYHPSLFQSQAIWENATRSVPKNVVNHDTAAAIEAFMASHASASCTMLCDQEAPTVLSVLFFGQQNIDILQQGLRRGVFEETGRLIGMQSQVAIEQMMLQVYSEHARNFNEVAYTWAEVKQKSIEELKRLNCIFYTNTIPRIIANIQHYLRYLQEKDKPMPVQPMPQYTVEKGNSVLTSF